MLRDMFMFEVVVDPKLIGDAGAALPCLGGFYLLNRVVL